MLKRCGIILEDQIRQEYLLVQGRLSSKWGFPKGHQEHGETEEQTAIRELFEETGILVHPPLGYRIRFKNNIYFVMDIERKNFRPYIRDHREIQNIRWFTKSELQSLPMEHCNYGLSMYRRRLQHELNNASYPPSLHDDDSYRNVSQSDDTSETVTKADNILEKSTPLSSSHLLYSNVSS